MFELEVNKEVATISSREVAEMMETRHDSLMRKIDGITKDFTDHKIVVSDFWVDSIYKDVTGRTLKEYQITKVGCEFLAHKSTGTKGNLFTARYMQRFEEMEKALQSPFSFEDMMIEQLKQMKVIKQQNLKNSEDIKDLKENSPLYNIECEEISKAVRKKGVQCLGGKESVAYNDKSIIGKVYSDIYSEIRRNFDVSSYKAVKRKFYKTALEIIKSYKLPLALEEIITELNGQSNQYTVESWVNS